MKFYMILFGVFATLSDTKAIPSSLYHVIEKLGHVVPVSYRTPLLAYRHRRRCFDNNILTNCPSSSQNLSKLSIKSVQNQSKINYNEKPRYKNIHDTEHNKNERFSRLLALVNNKLTFKLDKSNKKYFIKYSPLVIGNTRSELEEAKESSSKETNTIEKLFEIEKYKDNSSEKSGLVVNLFDTVNNYENISQSEETVQTWNEKVETSLEIEETTSEFVENNISPAEDMNLDYENIVNATFILAFDQFERKLYMTNFNKFRSLTPANGDSGMSFVQSGLFLGMSLMALSTEVDLDTQNEIDQYLKVNVSTLDKIELIKRVMSSLPNSSEELKYYSSSRLVLRSGRQLSQQFTLGTAEALHLKIDHFEDAQKPEGMAKDLNRMIEKDSDGAIRDTFDEEDLSENEEAVLITTLYFRARWRSDPTLHNGTWVFRDTRNTPPKTVRMIRINDIMKYAALPEWDAEAVEIPYLTQGLSLLILVPQSNSLRRLTENVTKVDLTCVTERMQSIRIAVSLPLFTLRMTLLLPNKLQDMGISRIVESSAAQNGSLRISQAVQRIMFWAEAGRNAYKDDGIEWDTPPEMKIVIDRPYIFYVRWKNISLMMGNFVL